MSSSKHTISPEEIKGITTNINTTFADESFIKSLQLPHGKLPFLDDELFEVLKDGVILCHFVNCIASKNVVSRVVAKAQMTIFQMHENLNRALLAAQLLGCKLTNIGPSDLRTNESPYLTLGLLWQLVRFNIQRQIKEHVKILETSSLQEEHEDREAFLKKTPEELLLRWFNKHLEVEGFERRVSNFSDDIKDSLCYSVLLHSLAKSVIPPLLEKAKDIKNLEERAIMILENADLIDCKQFVTAQDIVNGAEVNNFAFVALLFEKYPGMKEIEITEEILSEVVLSEEIPIEENVIEAINEKKLEEVVEKVEEKVEEELPKISEKSVEEISQLLKEKLAQREEYTFLPDPKLVNQMVLARKIADMKLRKNEMEKLISSHQRNIEKLKEKQKDATEITKYELAILEREQQKELEVLMERLEKAELERDHILKYADYSQDQLFSVIDQTKSEAESIKKEIDKLEQVKNEVEDEYDEQRFLSRETKDDIRKLEREMGFEQRMMEKKESGVKMRIEATGVVEKKRTAEENAKIIEKDKEEVRDLTHKEEVLEERLTAETSVFRELQKEHEKLVEKLEEVQHDTTITRDKREAVTLQVKKSERKVRDFEIKLEKTAAEKKFVEMKREEVEKEIDEVTEQQIEQTEKLMEVTKIVETKEEELIDVEDVLDETIAKKEIAIAETQKQANLEIAKSTREGDFRMAEIQVRTTLIAQESESIAMRLKEATKKADSERRKLLSAEHELTVVKYDLDNVLGEKERIEKELNTKTAMSNAIRDQLLKEQEENKEKEEELMKLQIQAEEELKTAKEAEEETRRLKNELEELEKHDDEIETMTNKEKESAMKYREQFEKAQERIQNLTKMLDEEQTNTEIALEKTKVLANSELRKIENTLNRTKAKTELNSANTNTILDQEIVETEKQIREYNELKKKLENERNQVEKEKKELSSKKSKVKEVKVEQMKQLETLEQEKAELQRALKTEAQKKNELRRRTKVSASNSAPIPTTDSSLEQFDKMLKEAQMTLESLSTSSKKAVVSEEEKARLREKRQAKINRALERKQKQKASEEERLQQFDGKDIERLKKKADMTIQEMEETEKLIEMEKERLRRLEEAEKENNEK